MIGTLFIVFCLWIIEGFEPQTRLFELTVKMGDKTTDLEPKIEEVLRRYKARYELRTTAEDNVVYMVTTPKALRTDRVSNAHHGAAARQQGRRRVGRKSQRQSPEVTR